MRKLKLKGYYYVVLAILWGVFFLGFSVRMAIIITMPLISNELEISHSQEGMLLSIISVAYGMIQFPSGFLSDIFDNKSLLIIVTISLLLAMAGVSTSQDLLPFAFYLFLTGLFVGFSSPISFSIISKKYKSRRGAMIGLYNTAPPISQFLGTYVSGVLAISYSWRYVYCVWIIIGFGLSIFIWKFVKSTKFKRDEPKISVKAIKSFFSNRPLMCFLVPFIAHSISAFSVLNMNPLYMVEVWGLDVVLTAAVFGATRLIGFVGSILGGFLSDKFSKIKLLLISLICTAICIYAFTTLSFSPFMVFILCLQSISINFFFPTIYSLILGLTSSSMIGKAQGLYNSIAFTIGGLAPYIMGVIIDLSSFKLAFMFPLLTAIFGIVWILISMRMGYTEKRWRPDVSRYL